MCKNTVLSLKWAYMALLWKKDLNIQGLWHFPLEGEKKPSYVSVPALSSAQLFACSFMSLYHASIHICKNLDDPPASSARSDHLEMQKWPRIFSYIRSQGGGKKFSSLSQRRKIRSAICLSAMLSLSRKWVLHFLLAKPDSCTLELRHNLTLNPDWCVVFCTAYLFETCTVSDHICS